MGRPQLTKAGFIERSQAVHGDRYDYTPATYVKAHQKVTICCSLHGEFSMTPANHMQGQGCPKCRYVTIANKQRGTKADFAVKSAEVHKGKYTYDRVVYTRAYGKVLITCPAHGDFLQAPATHLEGSGCPACAKRPKVDTLEFIKRAQALHGGKYDYSHSLYVNAKQPVEILCPIHGGFKQNPHEHSVKGIGCPQCGDATAGVKRQFTKAQFVTMAVKVHGTAYTYANADYKWAREKVSITCPRHGDFMQKPNHHLAGFGCPSCRGIVSKPEHEIVTWLRARGVVVEQSRRDLIAPKELDLYLPEHKLAIEYCGMYWHSHKNAEDEAKNKHRHWEKHKLCAERGIRLITLYETEWLERKAVIKRFLRAATGNMRGKVMARKCALRMVDAAEAKVFFDAYHPQGAAGGGVYYGLYWGTKLVACMRFAYGINDRGAAGKNKEWTLSRYATRINVNGGASRLLSAFLKDSGYPAVKSFSDNRLFAGGMYTTLGFTLVEDIPPDYAVWSQKTGLRPKTHYQRRELPNRLLERGRGETFDPVTDARTEQEMTYLIGAARIYDCGKKRWRLDAGVAGL